MLLGRAGSGRGYLGELLFVFRGFVAYMFLVCSVLFYIYGRIYFFSFMGRYFVYCLFVFRVVLYFGRYFLVF